MTVCEILAGNSGGLCIASLRREIHREKFGLRIADGRIAGGESKFHVVPIFLGRLTDAGVVAEAQSGCFGGSHLIKWRPRCSWHKVIEGEVYIVDFAVRFQHQFHRGDHRGDFLGGVVGVLNDLFVLVGVFFEEFFGLDSLGFEVGEFAAEILRHLVELLGGEAVLTSYFVVADDEIAFLLDDVEFGIEDGYRILDYFLAAVGGVTKFFLLSVFLCVEAMIYRYDGNILIVNADADRLFVDMP